jgi:hypothetical protein
MLEKLIFSSTQPRRAETRLFPCVVLASFSASTYSRGYASALRSLRPTRTAVLRILPGHFSMFQIAEPSDFQLAMAVFMRRDREAYGN